MMHRRKFPQCGDIGLQQSCVRLPCVAQRTRTANSRTLRDRKRRRSSSCSGSVVSARGTRPPRNTLTAVPQHGRPDGATLPLAQRDRVGECVSSSDAAPQLYGEICDALHRATSAALVSPMQQPVMLDENGAAPNTASLSKVPPQWRSLLDSTAERCQRVLGGNFASLYIRGSVPQGTPIAGLSDLDCIVYYWRPVAQNGRKQPDPAASPDSPRPRLSSSIAIQRELRALAAQLQSQFPFCVKVELKAIGLSGRSRWTEALQGRGSGGGKKQGISRLPPPLLPAAFEIATGVPWWLGWILRRCFRPQLLSHALRSSPPSQTLTQGQCARRIMGLYGVTGRPYCFPWASPTDCVCPQDVLAAGEAVREAVSKGEAEAAARAGRWALKRTLRAAQEAAADSVRWYTRDLYWCCHAGTIGFPELEEPLVEALVAYMRLSDCDESAILSEAVRAAELAQSLAESLLRAYWSGTLDSGTGEVDQALSLLPLPAWSERALRTRRDSPLRSQPGGGFGQMARRVRQAWFGIRSQLSDTEATLASKATSASHELPALRNVLEVDCRPAAVHDQALLLTAEGKLPSEPVILRGAAADWPAVERWTLQYFAAQPSFRGLVRVSPTSAFPFCEPALLEVLVALLGEAAAPSMPIQMSAAEFVVRLGGSVTPLLYEGGEQYYMQADLTRQLLEDVNFHSGVFRELQGRLFDRQVPEGARAAASLARWGQRPRAWISGPGSVSPTHFDSSPSFLVQVRGEKRMLFWPPEQLPLMRPFPSSHLMRRRCQTPLENAPQPLCAALHPGDAVFFPPEWAHYTESLSTSVSVTARLRQGTD